MMKSKFIQWLLGVLTFGSIIGAIVSTFILPRMVELETIETFKDIFMWIFLGLFLFYFFYATRSDAVPEDKRILWAALIFFGNMLVMPIFWYHYILKNRKGSDEKKAT